MNRNAGTFFFARQIDNMMMKRIIVVTAAMVLCFDAAVADERSQELLGELQKKVAGWGDYRVEFGMTIDGQSLAGSYEVSGESYHVVTPEIELFCNGAVKWEVNHILEEVTIDTVIPGDRTVMGNPTRLFDFLDGSYAHRYVGEASVGGVNCRHVELVAGAASGENAGAGMASSGEGSGAGVATSVSGLGSGERIDVFLSVATGLPVRVGYAIGFLNADATIDIVRITPRVTLDRAAFGYDPKRYEGYEVIDFR